MAKRVRVGDVYKIEDPLARELVDRQAEEIERLKFALEMACAAIERADYPAMRLDGSGKRIADDLREKFL